MISSNTGTDKCPASERHRLVAAHAVNAVWSMDFVSDSLASDRRLKCLTITDDFSRECVDIAVDHDMEGDFVIRVLDQAALFRGCPRAIRTDNAGWSRATPD